MHNKEDDMAICHCWVCGSPACYWCKNCRMDLCRDCGKSHEKGLDLSNTCLDPDIQLLDGSIYDYD